MLFMLLRMSAGLFGIRQGIYTVISDYGSRCMDVYVHELPVVVVSMRNSVRRGPIRKNLQALNLTFEFQDGVNTRSDANCPWSKAMRRTGECHGYKISRHLLGQPGDVGCALGHLEVWEKYKNHKAIVVMEDDGRLHGDLSKPVRLHSTTNFVTMVFRDGASGRPTQQSQCGRPTRTGGFCTAGYIITRAGMRKYLKMARAGGLVRPIDHWMWEKGGVMATDPGKLRVAHGRFVISPGQPLTPDIDSERVQINRAMGGT